MLQIFALLQILPSSSRYKTCILCFYDFSVSLSLISMLDSFTMVTFYWLASKKVTCNWNFIVRRIELQVVGYFLKEMMLDIVTFTYNWKQMEWLFFNPSQFACLKNNRLFSFIIFYRQRDILYSGASKHDMMVGDKN